jgi:hypothetical protein
MQKNNFKFEYSLHVLTRFSTPVKWWQFKKIHTLTLPALSETDISSTLNLSDMIGEIELVAVQRSFLDSSRGRSFFTAYLSELNKLTDLQREYLKQHFNNLLGYSFDLIVENKLSHPNPITLDAFELIGTRQLQHTASALKTAQLSGKKLILNDDSTDSFTEEYAYIASYWQIENDIVELRYQDWDAETDEDADKVHISFLEAKPFTQQFSRAANEITDYLQKMAGALKVSLKNLEV